MFRKLFLSFSALFLIAGTVSAQVAPPPSQPLTFFRYAGDQVVLQKALDCAIGRWRAATCLPIDLSYAPAHWVRQDDVDNIATNVPGEHTGQTWGSSWNAQKIKLANTLTEDASCQVLVHEIEHLISRSYNHSAVDGSMSFPVTHVIAQPRSRIMEVDLGRVCAKQPCGCFNPETP